MLRFWLGNSQVSPLLVVGQLDHLSCRQASWLWVVSLLPSFGKKTSLKRVIHRMEVRGKKSPSLRPSKLSETIRKSCWSGVSRVCLKRQCTSLCCSGHLPLVVLSRRLLERVPPLPMVPFSRASWLRACLVPHCLDNWPKCRSQQRSSLSLC